MLDFHGGLNDIRNKVTRTIVKPSGVLISTPNVVLRSIRFRGKFDYPFAEDLEAEMAENAVKYAKMVSPSLVMLNIGNMRPFYNPYIAFL